MNLSHKYSLVDFEPTGRVAQCLGLQDIWDLWNIQESSREAQTLQGWPSGMLAHFWHGWHTGTVDKPMAQVTNDVTPLSHSG